MFNSRFSIPIREEVRSTGLPSDESRELGIEHWSDPAPLARRPWTMRMSSFVFVVFLCATAANPARAQDPDPGQPAQGASDNTKQENPSEPEAHGTRLRWQDIPKNVLHDEKAIFTSPFRINRENVKWWALLGGG